jgi:hypothetical protein
VRSTINIAPPNSIIFVMDRRNKDTPILTEGLIVANPSCVVIGTYPEPDGETTIILTDEATRDVGAPDSLAFTGSIRVPSRDLSVSTAYHDVLLSMPTSSEEVRLRVWVNHPECPDRIIIAAD